MNQLTLQNEIKKYDWYHAIDLGNGVVTPRRFYGRPPNSSLFPVYYLLENISIRNMDCIDIGTADGLSAFILKQEGARKVVATDRTSRETFIFVRDYLNLEIDYIPHSTVDNYNVYKKLIERGLPTKYDLILLTAVIQHNYDPLVVMMHARKMLKLSGLMIVETVYHPGDDPALYFNTECTKPWRSSDTYFLPTITCLHAFSRYLSTKPLATVVNAERVAILMQACRPNEIEGKSEILDLIINKGAHYGPLKFSDLTKESEQSNISYTGRQGMWFIDMNMFKTRFSLQPRVEDQDGQRLGNSKNPSLKPLND